MQRRHNANKVDLYRCERMTRTLAWCGISLLSLCAISILSMPVTQYLWSWDRFLHGGQDFESGILMALTFLCLALVLLKQCKRNVIDSLIFICLMIFKCGHDLLPFTRRIRASASCDAPIVNSPPAFSRVLLRI